MSLPPAEPKIYHITHGRNLASLIARGELMSDARRLDVGLACELVGMSRIKQRRLTEIEVACHPGTMVGQYTPFYFCPRSVMLYLLHRGNHEDVAYQGGQRGIVHLQADVHRVVGWASAEGRRWAFTAGNAGSYFVEFFDRVEALDRVDWEAVANPDFRDPIVKERKQAEFLVYEALPWRLIEVIGVINSGVQQRVETILAGAEHRPRVEVQRAWYY